MMETAMLSPDRMSDLAPLPPPPPTTTSCAAPSPTSGQLARAARDRADRRSRRRHADRAASSVPPLGRADAESLPAGAHARQRAQAAARFRERARRLLRGRPVRPRPAARPVRHPRGDVAGRMEVRRRRPDDLLRLPSLPVRHRAGDGDATRPCGPRLRRSRRGKGRARRHAQPLAEGELRRGLRAHRAALRAHLRQEAVARRTGRCASC